MDTDFQLDTWLRGVPLHDHDTNSCVPDFSCCHPQLLAPFEERVLFIEAWRTGRGDICNGMLLIFLSKLYPKNPVEGFYHA